jgi:hypothetical protein
LSPKLARQLADMGASPEVIAIAIEAVTLASRDASRFVTVIEPSAAALRARRYRLNLKQKQGGAKATKGVTQSVTRHVTEKVRLITFLLSLNKVGLPIRK